MGGCVESGLATVSGATVSGGFTICSRWLRLFNLAATEGFAVFGVRAAGFGVDGGAIAARFCDDKSFAAASGGASKEGIAPLKRAVKKGSPFLGSSEAIMPTGSTCIKVGVGGTGALAVWFAGPLSPRGAIADGVFASGCGASLVCSPESADDQGSISAPNWSGTSTRVATCDDGSANSVSASEAPAKSEWLFQKAMPAPRPASPTMTTAAMRQIRGRASLRSTTPTGSEATVRALWREACNSSVESERAFDVAAFHDSALGVCGRAFFTPTSASIA